MSRGHAHPCGFRLSRVIDRGWGELACQYKWASDLESTQELDHCYLYEVTHYAADSGEACAEPGWHLPPDPPFLGWRLRNPTDGRMGGVGMERFSAVDGCAWDRHKLQGPLSIPRSRGRFQILASQQFRFYCEVCCADFDVMGEDGGPHTIVRSFRSLDGSGAGKSPPWRYETGKHGACAWMDVDAHGYVEDSAGIGFGPFWLGEGTCLISRNLADRRRDDR